MRGCCCAAAEGLSDADSIAWLVGDVRGFAAYRQSAWRPALRRVFGAAAERAALALKPPLSMPSEYLNDSSCAGQSGHVQMCEQQ